MKILSMLIAIVGLLFNGNLHAENFPTQTVKIYTAMPVGSGPDVVIRKIAQQLSADWNVPVVVDAKPGGNGLVAINAMLNDNTKNHSFVFLGNDNYVLYPVLSNKKELIDQLTPVRGIMTTDLFLATNVNVSDLAAFRNQLQSSPIHYGSWGVGSAPHTSTLALLEHLNLPGTHIPYKDYNQWFPDLLTGRLTFSFVSPGSSSKYEAAKKIKYLATTSSTRNPKYPDVPTTREAFGISIVSGAWSAIFVDQSTPPDTIEFIGKSVFRALHTKEVNDVITNLDFAIMNVNSDQAKAKIDSEQKQLSQTIKKYKISIN